jgi:hypothetical protein
MCILTFIYRVMSKGVYYVSENYFEYYDIWGLPLGYYYWNHPFENKNLYTIWNGTDKNEPFSYVNSFQTR